MSLAGNPKKIAYDIALGYVQFTQATLRQYNPQELKALLFNLNTVLREVRGKQVALENTLALKDKNLMISRLHQAVLAIQNFASTRKIKL